MKVVCVRNAIMGAHRNGVVEKILGKDITSGAINSDSNPQRILHGDHE